MHVVRFSFVIYCMMITIGCTTARLRQRTINQGSTLPDLQYQQILSNLALFAANPSALPWHVNLREGTTQITDSASAGAVIDLGPPVATQPQLIGSRTAVAQWGMSPVIDPIELQLLRVAYRRAHGFPEMPSYDLLEELAHELKEQFASNADLRNETELFFELHSQAKATNRELNSPYVTTNDTDFLADSEQSTQRFSPLARNVRRKIQTIERELAEIEPGWFKVGCKRDVPKCACYVGRSGDCYVWVESTGQESLTRFTLTVLKLSTLIKETQTLVSPGSVKFSPGDRG